MPAGYAHYRFGVSMLDAMPADVRRTVNRFRRLYDVGLHGPDPFFYYSPLKKNKVNAAGSAFHRQTGIEFFGRVCRMLRLEPSEGAEAYLYGVLCHYCLDSICHPFINGESADGRVLHTEIEAEFDRWLLVLDGKIPPERQDLSGHMQLTAGEAETAARFYPGISVGQMHSSVRNMARITSLMAAPDGAGRRFMKKSADLVSRSYGGTLMEPEGNPRCEKLNAPLMERYCQAEEQFPEYLEQLCAHLTYSAPLGESFRKNFG